jgi:hypothetical protein
MTKIPLQAANPRREPSPAIALDQQLLELIEVVWGCEVAARREDRIDIAIRYGIASESR